MRRLTFHEKQYIDALIDYSPDQSFPIGQYVADQRLFSTRDLLAISFLLWFLEENGYVYITQRSPFSHQIDDVNIKRYLSGINDGLKGRVIDLLGKDVFLTDQLLDLKNSNYKSLEEEQLDLTKQILDNAVVQTDEAQKQTKEALSQTSEARNQTAEALKQTEEAKAQTQESLKQTSEALKQTEEALNQTKEAKYQTAEALKQTAEALHQTRESSTQTGEVLKQMSESRKQTQWALGTFIISLITLLISIVFSITERNKESLPKPSESAPLADTSGIQPTEEAASDSSDAIVEADTLLEHGHPNAANDKAKE